MRHFAAATLVAITTATAATAGGLSDPVVDPVVIREDAAQGSAPSASLVLILTTLAVFGTAAGG